MNVAKRGDGTLAIDGMRPDLCNSATWIISFVGSPLNADTMVCTVIYLQTLYHLNREGLRELHCAAEVRFISLTSLLSIHVAGFYIIFEKSY